jgi:ATP-dependent helicase/nuclease subunit B
MENPEETDIITPLERGSLVHEILERFIVTCKRQGTLPVPGESWSDGHRQMLHDIAHQAFLIAEARGVTGKALRWELEKTDILLDLDTFLEEDTRLRQKFQVSPHIVETWFGPGGGEGGSWAEAVYEAKGVGTLRFKGIIDRVDIDPTGRLALVLDYKTGSTSAYEGMKKDDVDGGRRLQLAVYSLAARGALGEGVQVRAAYWFITSKGKFALMPSGTIESEAVLERFGGAITAIAGGISEGLFPANPGEATNGDFKNCRFCEFKRLCPARKDVMWERKRRDPRLASYLELTGGQEAK